jgi:hypothetical protein
LDKCVLSEPSQTKSLLKPTDTLFIHISVNQRFPNSHPKVCEWRKWSKVNFFQLKIRVKGLTHNSISFDSLRIVVIPKASCGFSGNILHFWLHLSRECSLNALKTCAYLETGAWRKAPFSPLAVSSPENDQVTSPSADLFGEARRPLRGCGLCLHESRRQEVGRRRSRPVCHSASKMNKSVGHCV